jgi:hypothetical protein
MIYDKVKTARLLRVVLDVTEGGLDLAARPGGEPSLRQTVLAAEKTMRALHAKGDTEGMYHEYLALLQQSDRVGATLERHHQKSFESEFYRFYKIFLERE